MDQNLDENQRAVKAAIYDLLDSRGLAPSGYFKRRLGGWGFAEADNSMSQSQGAIVLGFAQWECKGLGPRKDSGLKASEGNHFEGGLAIAHHVPLLVIMEDGTQARGILAEGSTHSVVPMPRGAGARWVREDQLFDEQFKFWFESIKRPSRKKIFIGHGHSKLWLELKDFIQDRAHLSWDEFNRVPVAGTTTVSRLTQMLDEAAIAFLIMTAEDEQRDGTLRARANVVHEAGLVQGRLGFERAIILLEEGAESFSNIDGLSVIPFPKGDIKHTFEDVRLVLERERLL